MSTEELRGRALAALKAITFVVPISVPFDNDGNPLMSTSNTVAFAEGAVVPMISDIQIDIVVNALQPLLEQVAGEGREQARGYATHKTKCKAYPATSEEQILRDCDCGFVKLFGWSSSNKGAVAAALAKQSGSSK